MTWRGYFGIENLGLTAGQRATLVAELRALGPSSATENRPNHLNHWRTRLDNDAAIFEASFNVTNLSINKFKQRLGTIFGVDPATIDHAIQNFSFDGGTTPVVTFARTGTDRLRVALFGDIGATWEGSRLEAVGYLAANAAAWGDV
jgi:hypothetical protein